MRERNYFMIDISNVKKVENETHLFISTADGDEVTWLLEKAGAKEGVDFTIYPRHMILKNKVPALYHLSHEDRAEELRTMYGAERASVLMSVASVVVSNYDKNGLYEVLKPIIVDGEHDKDYHDCFWEENEKYQQDEWPTE